jgi:trk system potassium uptake protein TrkA
MEQERTIAVLGLGTFGRSLCVALARSGVTTIAVDRHEENVALVKEIADVAVVGDATDPSVLESAGIPDCDVAVVAIGENTESSIITTLNLQDLSVPRIYARAMTTMHRRVLRKLGITQVINPEEEAAVRLASTLAERGVEQLVDLGEGFSFVLLSVPEPLVGKTLAELNLRQNHRVNVVGIRRGAEGRSEAGTGFSFSRFVLPDGNTTLEVDDRLLVVGRTDDIRTLAELRRLK